MEEDTKAVVTLLKGYAKAEDNIREYEEALAEIEEKKKAEYKRQLKAQQYDRDKVTGGEIVDQVSESVAKLVDIYGDREEALRGFIKRAEGRKIFIEDIVEKASLSKEEKKSIRLRYFCGYRAWQAAGIMGYSLSRERDFNRLGLEKIKEAIYN